LIQIWELGTGSPKDVRLSHHDLHRKFDKNKKIKHSRSKSTAPSPWQIQPVKRDQRIVITQQMKILIS
jgi:hypothetical protein